MTQLAYVNYSPHDTYFHQKTSFALPSSQSSTNNSNILDLYGRVKRQELENCLAVLEDLKGRERNWDGYDSDKPNLIAIDNTKAFLEIIFSLSYSTGFGWNSPHISADSHGDIVLEWWGPQNKKITFYIGNTQNQIEYIKSTNANINEMEDGLIKNFTEASYINFFGWLR